MTPAAGAVCISPAPYLPFCDPVQRKVPGLFPLLPKTWVQRDAAFPAQMALRDDLVAAKGHAVAAVLPEGRDALGECLNAVAAHLIETDPDYRRQGANLVRPDGQTVPVDGAAASLARLAQEDWLILTPRPGHSEYVLVGGALCFPAHWNLPDKLGLPLTQVHGPVPDYRATLADRVNRIFAALHVDRPLQRLNWSLGASDDLYCPHPHMESDYHAPTHLRVERQTVRRLPDTEAVVFGVKTYLTPLVDLPPTARAALGRAVGDLSAEMRAYKGGATFLARIDAGEGDPI